MRKILFILLAVLSILSNINCSNNLKSTESNTVVAIVSDSNEVEGEQEEGYDGAALREQFEFDRIVSYTVDCLLTLVQQRTFITRKPSLGGLSCYER